MKKISEYILIVIFVGSVIMLAMLAPSMLSKYTDAKILDSVRVESNDVSAGGYRYSLTPNERLYILFMAVNNQTPPQSDYAASLKEKASAAGNDSSASYAYIANYRGPSEKELSREKAMEACGDELALMRELGVIPYCDYETGGVKYDAELYSAVDMLEPEKNVSVWQIGYSKGQQLSMLTNSLLDAYIDAETGKIYGLSLRSRQIDDNFDADKIIAAWCGYLGLEMPEAVTDDNPLMETTPYYKKYSVNGIGDGKTTVTVGFYEGINEFFIRIKE